MDNTFFGTKPEDKEIDLFSPEYDWSDKIRKDVLGINKETKLTCPITNCEGDWEKYIQKMLDGFKMVSTDSNSEYVKLENFEMFLTGIGTGYMTYCDQIETIKELSKGLNFKQPYDINVDANYREVINNLINQYIKPSGEKRVFKGVGSGENTPVKKGRDEGDGYGGPIQLTPQNSVNKYLLDLARRNTIPTTQPFGYKYLSMEQKRQEEQERLSLQNLSNKGNKEFPSSPSSSSSGESTPTLSPPGSSYGSLVSSLGTPFVPRKRGGSNPYNMKGGKLGNACDGGKILMFTDKTPDNDKIETNIDNLLTNAFITASLAKTPDELSHDFLKYFKGQLIEEIISTSYDPMLNYFTKKLEAMNKEQGNQQDKQEVEKLLGFINTLRSNTVINDHEWNYYVSALKYIDEECNRLDDINIFMVGKTDTYQFLKNPSLPKWQLKEKTSSSSSSSSASDSAMDVLPESEGEDSGDSGTYTYYNTSEGSFMAVGDGIFPFDLVLCEDNSIAVPKLSVLLNDINNSNNVRHNSDDNTYTVKSEAISDLTKSCIKLATGPNLCDPSTIGPIPISKFETVNTDDLKFFQKNTNVKDDKEAFIELINHVQQLQDINKPESVVARSFFIEAINKFMAMFGVKSGFVSIDDSITYPSVDPGRQDRNINFIETNDDKYNGIHFYLQQVQPGQQGQPVEIDIMVGDTTIKNISAFILFFRDNGGIPYEWPGQAPTDLLLKQWASWFRLHKFATEIFKRIPDDTLTGIKEEMGIQTVDITNPIFKSRILQQIIISLKSFGDASQVDYIKKMSTYLKQEYGLNIYISSSDKNVAGEAFLTDTPTWIVGLGTRQHASFYKSRSYVFNIEQFKKEIEAGKYNGEKPIENIDPQLLLEKQDTKFNTMKAITTNSSLATVEMIQSDIQTYAKVILSYNNSDDSMDTDISNIEEPSNWITYVNKLQYSPILTEQAKIEINKTPLETEDKKLLTDLKCFLKKICDTLAFTDEDYRTVFKEKLEVISNFVQLKLSKTLIDFVKKYDISTKKTAITKIINEGLSYANPIISNSTIDFASKYLTNGKDMFTGYASEFQDVMDNAVFAVEEVICVFNKAPEPNLEPSRMSKRADAKAKRDEVRRQQREVEIENETNEALEKEGRKIGAEERKIRSKIEDTNSKIKKLLKTQADIQQKIAKNTKKRIPKMPNQLLNNIKKQQQNLEKFTRELKKIKEAKIEEIKEKIKAKLTIPTGEEKNKELGELRNKISGDLGGLKEKFGISTSSSASSSASTMTLDTSASTSASSSALDSDISELLSIAIEDFIKEVGKAETSEVTMTEVPTEETAGQSEDINFDDLYNLTRDAQLNIDNINNNEENKAHVLEDISSMLVQMEHDDDENNVLNEILDSILDQIVLNNDIVEPETISSSSSSSLSGKNIQSDLVSGRSRSDSISSLSSLSSIGSYTNNNQSGRYQQDRYGAIAPLTVPYSPSFSAPGSPSSTASTQIIGSQGGSRKHYKKHYITKRRLTKHYRKKTKKYFRRRHAKQSRRK
jgi:hypothetical protein